MQIKFVIKTLFLISIFFVSSHATAWSSQDIISCATQDITAPFESFKIVRVQRYNAFYLAQIFKNSKYPIFESYASAPYKNNQVVTSSYTSSVLEFQFMLHLPTGDTSVVLNSKEKPRISTIGRRYDFKCQIVNMDLIKSVN